MTNQLVFANNERVCKIVNNDYKICTESNVLVSVSEWSENNQVKKFNKSLEIDARGISSITPNAFKNLKITQLDITFNGATINLEPESFDGLRWLKKLRFSYGNITLKKNLFKSIKSLNSLSLPINQSGQVLSETLNDFDNLKYLEIDNCNLGEINPYYFGASGLNYLKLLRLDYNKINQIDPYAFAEIDQSIELLSLTFNELKSVKSKSFGELNTTVLYLSNNLIDTIEDGAFENSHIGDIYLFFNFDITVDKAAWKIPESTHVFQNNTDQSKDID
ncbi:decorin-like [Aphidius gifuensis]|uniref:decorin-like n=1 Tax=Aphidius gifuensis TaxID=684658 RepID=UPI001CDB8A2B|nr:decorin-like [Aphidius gifuensis]